MPGREITPATHYCVVWFTVSRNAVELSRKRLLSVCVPCLYLVIITIIIMMIIIIISKVYHKVPHGRKGNQTC